MAAGPALPDKRLSLVQRTAPQACLLDLQMRDWWDEKRQAQNAETLRT